MTTEFYNMHKDDVLHLRNKLQSSSCSTDPKVLSSPCIIYNIKSTGVVKSQNSVHTLLKTINIIFLTLQIQKGGLDGILMLSISLENINNLKKYLGPDYMDNPNVFSTLGLHSTLLNELKILTIT